MSMNQWILWGRMVASAAASRLEACKCLVLSGCLAAVLLWAGAANAFVTTTWSTGANSTSSTVAGIMVTQIGDPGAQNYGNNNFQTDPTWWSDPYGSTVSGQNGLNFLNEAGRRSYTITFSKPVNNPVLHVSRLGGNTGVVSNSSIWNLTSSVSQSGAVALTRLSGNTQFNVAGNSFRRTTGVNVGSGGTDCTTGVGGTACGSVRVDGTGLTSLTFTVTGADDQLQFRWSFEGSNVVVRKQSTGAVGTFAFTGANGVGSFSLNTTATNPAASASFPVTNHANAITITESTLPANFTLASAACVDQNGTAVASTLDAGTRQLTIAGTDYGANQTITCTFVNAQAIGSLQISKTGLPATVSTSGLVDYTITVTNNGTTPITGATVLDTVPAGLNCTTAPLAAPTCSACASAITAAALTTAPGVMLTTLAPAAVATITLQCRVTATGQ